MNMAFVKWTEENKNILRNVYPTGGTSQVLLLISGSTKDSIITASRRFGVKYDKNFSFKNKLAPLLEENNFNYYWYGFLMADGHFSLSGNSNIKVKISVKDEDHLKILANYLKVNINHSKTNDYGNYKCSDSCIISVADSKNIITLFEKLKIKSQKTYNPPDFSFLNTKDKFLSFLAGFIDGDGCITKRLETANMIRIQCHYSWLNNLNFFSINLKKYLNIDSKSFIDNQGFSKFVLHSFNQLKKLKIELIKLDIPMLKRKWDIINHEKEYIFRKNEHIKEIVCMLDEKYSVNDIAQKFNCSIYPIHKIKKELKNKTYVR